MTACIPTVDITTQEALFTPDACKHTCTHTLAECKHNKYLSPELGQILQTCIARDKAAGNDGLGGEGMY